MTALLVTLGSGLATFLIVVGVHRMLWLRQVERTRYVEQRAREAMSLAMQVMRRQGQ